jgi:hypothetical protein
LPRKPADVAHINFRIREHLRRKLEAEAKRHKVSLNAEMHTRLEQSFEAAPVAQIVQDIDRQITLMEVAWLRFDVTPDFLTLVDQLTAKVLDDGERDEFGRELSGLARELRRLRATVGQPLREPGPGVRLQGEDQP